MHPALDQFVADCAMPELAAGLRALDHAAIANRDARELWRAFVWIASRDERTVDEKLGAILKLYEFGKARAGSEVLYPSLKKFCGW
jgi:hypothetical protein